jgi:hypothetical protein
MKIEITEKEITAGVRLALENTLGLKLAGKTFEVEYSMGRKVNGLTAVVSVTERGQAPIEVEQETDEVEQGTIGAAIAEATNTPKAAVLEDRQQAKEPIAEIQEAAAVPPAVTEVVEAGTPEVAVEATDEDNLFG